MQMPYGLHLEDLLFSRAKPPYKSVVWNMRGARFSGVSLKGSRIQPGLHKTQHLLRIHVSGFVGLLLFAPLLSSATGIPEPGPVMYGALRNSANGNARLTTGTLTWTITPASGSPVTVTTPLTDISGQYSYALRVPFESVVGSSTLSANALQLNNATTSYVRTNVFLTVNGTNYPATISAPARCSFTFGSADRGRLDEEDLNVTAQGVGGSTGGSSSIASPPTSSTASSKWR